MSIKKMNSMMINIWILIEKKLNRNSNRKDLSYKFKEKMVIILMQLIHFLKLAPKISNTEKIALTSGTVWVDGELFSGKPN